MTLTATAKNALVSSLCLVLSQLSCHVRSAPTPCPTSSVPDSPPDSFDVALYHALFADSNYVSLLPERIDRQPRNVVMLIFDSTATHEQRQAAIHAVCGRVFGGALYYYFVQVTTDGTASGLWRAIRLLQSQPGVARAEPVL